MCFIAAAPAAGAAASTGMGMAGYATIAAALTGMYAARQQANMTEDVAKANAKSANIEAGQIKEQGMQEASDIRTNTRQMIARQAAETAATGGQTGAGSPLDILKDTARVGAIEEGRSLTNTARKANTRFNQGLMERAKGKFAGYNANLKMAGTALSTASKVSDRWNRFKTVT